MTRSPLPRTGKTGGGGSVDGREALGPPAKQHHALADARWARDAYRSVAGRDDGIRPSGVVDYVVDAEFIDGDLEIDLVSLAVVADDGREFYAVSNEFDPSRANDFVATIVLPQLEGPGDPVWMSRQEIKDGLLAFVGDTTPRFWSWGGLPYDWMDIAQLFGVDERMPDGWLYTGYDITPLVNRAGFSTDPSTHGYHSTPAPRTTLSPTPLGTSSPARHPAKVGRSQRMDANLNIARYPSL